MVIASCILLYLITIFVVSGRLYGSFFGLLVTFVVGILVPKFVLENPRVIQQLDHVDSLRRILGEHLFDEIYQVVGSVSQHRVHVPSTIILDGLILESFEVLVVDFLVLDLANEALPIRILEGYQSEDKAMQHQP